MHAHLLFHQVVKMLWSLFWPWVKIAVSHCHDENRWFSRIKRMCRSTTHSFKVWSCSRSGWCSQMTTIYRAIDLKYHAAQHIDSMLDQCWASVVDDESTLIKHWVNICCLLGSILEIDPILGLRRRWWSIISPMLFLCIVFADADTIIRGSFIGDHFVAESLKHLSSQRNFLRYKSVKMLYHHTYHHTFVCVHVFSMMTLSNWVLVVRTLYEENTYYIADRSVTPIPIIANLSTTTTRLP